MSKTLCELKKYLKHDLHTYIPLVCQPRFVCTKCGRVANKKKYVCQPQKINEAFLSLPEHEAEIEWLITPV